MCENGRALWAPWRGYSPGMRVPQTDVTCGLSAIAVRSVCSCASIQGGADPHTTAVDRDPMSKSQKQQFFLSDNFAWTAEEVKDARLVDRVAKIELHAKIRDCWDCIQTSSLVQVLRSGTEVGVLTNAASHTQLGGKQVNAPITRREMSASSDDEYEAEEEKHSTFDPMTQIASSTALPSSTKSLAEKMSSMVDLTNKQQPDTSTTEQRFERSTVKDRRKSERCWCINSSIRAIFTSTNLITRAEEMYTTRPLSLFSNSAGAAAIQPPAAAGPNSGYLLLQDEGAEPNPSCCWGLCEDTRVRELPFPQNRILTITYTEHNGQSSCTHRFPALFIPVLYKSLSSNRYHVIVAKGKKKGKAYTCSREDDMTTCCFGQCVNDVKPREFDHRDIYQQVEVVCKRGKFTARSVAPDGFAPWPLRRKYWRLYASRPRDFDLTDAWGADEALRARTPALELPISGAGGAGSVVGRWYAPGVFVKEGDSLRRQMERSAFYEITLERRWEQVFACENSYGDRRTVEVKASAVLGGVEATRDGAGGQDGVVWFEPLDSAGERVGLSSPVWERMRWEQGRGGWVRGDGKVESLEEYGGVSPWKRFGCYVLVERFVVRRMDGSSALTVDFKHTGTIQSKWE
ncbi:hypothetical protein MUK42_19621 [Musa troglodytarum]|uniref:Uncharacterized protein n=1 Tax=Musa troglodytarum TaxID=320322 RepID=A0A9E7FWQ9_9LILI|nr:hypothetical protein MUK42_19621 [Musa troglodytarum]